jgi:hypothetical protein
VRVEPFEAQNFKPFAARPVAFSLRSEGKDYVL